MTGGSREIRGFDLIRVFLRSFLIQASWSYDRMQSLGFGYAMLPALKRLYADPLEYRTRVQLHLEYFNTQPYLASFILGAAVRIEEERATGRNASNASVDVSALKNSLMAPLGALGDSFFWAGLKPFAAAVGVTMLLTGSWWAPLLFLVVYNSVHIWLRAEGLVWGYRSAGDVVALIGRYQFSRNAHLLKTISLAVLGALLGMLPLWRPELRLQLRVPGIVLSVSGLLITVFLAAVLKRGGTPVKLMMLLAAVCIALAFAGVV